MAYRDGERHSGGMLAGVVLGGALVAAAAYILTSKNGQKIKRELREGYKEATNKVEQFIGGLKDTMQTHLSQKMEDISEKTSSTIGSAKEALTAFADLENRDFKQGLVVGGILGVALSIGSTLVFKASFEEKNSFNGIEHLGCQLIKWKNIAKEMMESVTGEGSNRDNSKIHHFPQGQSQTLDEVLDFAATGMKLWKKVKGCR